MISCKDNKNEGGKGKEAKVEINPGATDVKSILEVAVSNSNKLNDSTVLNYPTLLDSVYEFNNNTHVWSNSQHWLPAATGLLSFIKDSKDYGLFPGDYHYTGLSFIDRLVREDTLARKNEAYWSRADLMLTDAFFTLVKHLKQGRLEYDSVTLRKDSVLADSFYLHTLTAALQGNAVVPTLEGLEPKHKGYDSLKLYLKKFLAEAHFRKLTWLDYPYTKKDSAMFYGKLFQRLQEVGYLDSSAVQTDTAAIASAMRKYQANNKLKVTGRPTQETIAMMDNNDWEKFKRIAINMDRYKLLPDTMPKTYVWVSLPTFLLQVVDSDTVVMESKVIIGAPKTRTPLLTSEISNFVTFPQWTVPESIIMREMLAHIKQEGASYIKKQNMIVVDAKDSVRDPNTINWARMSRNYFPYQLKQREGDDNSLGVMKFNFRNKYDVYLHDTNGRWMFDKTFRALSHGCVRVQQWRKLSEFLVRNDTVRYKPDTLRAWIKRQEKHTIWGFARVPIFLRYFTVAGTKGELRFYDDIYGEDRLMRNKYFANKAIL